MADCQCVGLTPRGGARAFDLPQQLGCHYFSISMDVPIPDHRPGGGRALQVAWAWVFLLILASTAGPCPTTLAYATPAAPPKEAQSADPLDQDLRRGRFIEASARALDLLTRQPPPPVYGAAATASALLLQLDSAAELLRKAEEGKERNVRFHAGCVRAMIARNEARWDAAVLAAGEALKLDPTHPLPRLILALVRFDQKAFSEAEKEALAAIKLEPALAYAHTVLAMARRAQNRLEEAEAAYQQAIALDGADLRPQLGLAEINHQRGQISKATEAYSAIVKRNPDMLLARQGLAQIHLSQGAYDACIAEGLEILRRGPPSAPVLDLLARASIQLGKYADASKYLAALRSLPGSTPATTYQLALCLLAEGKSDDAGRELRGLGKKEAAVVAALAVVEQLGGRAEAADGFFRLALAGAEEGLRRRTHFHRATVDLGRKAWAEAAAELAKAEGFLVNLRPDLLDLPSLYASADPADLAATSAVALFLAEGFLEAGATACARAAREGSTDVLALIMQSNLMARKGRYDDARLTLSRVLSLAPDYAPAHFALGEIAFSQNDLASALPAYEQSVALDPNYLTYWTRLAHVYGQQRNAQKTEVALRNWLRLAPGSPVPYNELANHLANSGGNLDEALTLASQAVQRAPDQGAVLDTLGWVYYQRKEQAKAVDCFQRALKTKMLPAIRAEVLHHLGLAYLAQNDNPKALATFDAAIAAAPESPAAQECRSLVLKLRPPQ